MSGVLLRLGRGVVVLGLAGVLAACGFGGSGPAKGKALTPSGPVTAGTLGPDASVIKVGRTYGFAFPLMTNSTGRVVKLTGFQVDNVPANIHVKTYRLLSVDDTRGYLLASYIGDHSKGDYARYPDHSAGATIAPHQLSQYYPVVYFVLTGKVSTHATGCQVDYEIGKKRFEQTFDCSFSLSGA